MDQNQQDDDIELRLPTNDDMQFIRWLWSDSETMKPVGGPIHLTDEQSKRWFTQMINPGNSTDCYRLIFNNRNEPIGEISFHGFNLDDVTAEFNIKIASTNQGKGYAKKAMILFLDFFFNQLGGLLLVDDVASDNFRGQNVLLNFGFEHDANIKNVFRLRMTHERYNDLYNPKLPSLQQTAG
jgi:RimJ/RimL family protein N-acetyltransferase